MEDVFHFEHACHSRDAEVGIIADAHRNVHLRFGMVNQDIVCEAIGFVSSKDCLDGLPQIASFTRRKGCHVFERRL